VSYAVRPDGPLDQGDILRHVWTIRKTPASADEPVERKQTAVCVVSHGCDIDKPSDSVKRTDTVLVACVFLISAVDKGFQGVIRHNRVINAFYLPSGGYLPEDCFVDWRTVQPVDKAALLSARGGDAYVCTVVGDLLAAMGEHYWGFLFRPQ
jgi:hypothetical protein